VTLSHKLDKRVSFAIRAFGNGGLFGVTGWFWSRDYGFFRAYVTNLRLLIVIERANARPIVISPEKMAPWIA
jgi:hypothetical protein